MLTRQARSVSVIVFSTKDLNTSSLKLDKINPHQQIFKSNNRIRIDTNHDSSTKNPSSTDLSHHNNKAAPHPRRRLLTVDSTPIRLAYSAWFRSMDRTLHFQKHLLKPIIQASHHHPGWPGRINKDIIEGGNYQQKPLNCLDWTNCKAHPKNLGHWTICTSIESKVYSHQK